MLSYCSGAAGRCAAVLALTFTLSVTPALSQWIRTSGPEGGIIASFATTGKADFVAAFNSGIFRSDDNGATWTQVNFGISDLRSLAALGSILFANTDSGLYRSRDQGATWSRSQSGIESPYIQSIAVVGTSVLVDMPEGRFRSDDSGTTWKKLESPVLRAGASAYFSVGSTLFAVHERLYRSNDKGDSWTEIKQAAPQTLGEILTLAGSEKTLYAVTKYGGIHVSLDTGTHWAERNTGMTSKWSRSLFVKGDTLFAGTAEHGAFRSFDGGAHWAAIDSGLGNPTVKELTMSGAYLLAGTDAGIFRSGDWGASWEPANHGMIATHITSIKAIETTLFTSPWGGESYSSIDGGNSWTVSKSGLRNRNVYDFAQFQGNVFAATPNGVFRSRDAGQTWSRIAALDSSYYICMAVIGRYLIASSFINDEIFRSTDGVAWTRITTDIYAIREFAVFGKDLYATAGEKGIYRSQDTGLTWSPVSNSLKAVYIKAFASMGNSLYAGSEKGLLRLNVGDTSFTATGPAEPRLRIQALAVSESQLFAADRKGLFRSADSGKTWTDIGQGLGFPRVRALTISDGQLYAGTTGGGVWRRPLAELTSAVRAGIPKRIKASKAPARLMAKGRLEYLSAHGTRILSAKGQELLSSP